MAQGTMSHAKIKTVELLSLANVPTTATSYSCNWSDYDLLLIQARQYGNIRDTEVCSVDYFDTTSDGRKIVANDVINNMRYEIYKNGNNAVYVTQTVGTSDTRYGIYIFGVKIA